jgi:secondary thiamine-phosphate synthase enzyme
MWIQKEVQLPSYRRGFHQITDIILDQLPETKNLRIGVLHLLLKHTSASLSLNENADPTVMQDLEASVNHLVKEREAFYRHTYEGDDDMPAHIKSMLIGVSVSVPIKNGSLCLGTWQGIVLGEHRNQGGRRIITATLQGE